jgi:hypothetical protein
MMSYLELFSANSNSNLFDRNLSIRWNNTMRANYVQTISSFVARFRSIFVLRFEQRNKNLLFLSFRQFYKRFFFPYRDFFFSQLCNKQRFHFFLVKEIFRFRSFSVFRQISIIPLLGPNSRSLSQRVSPLFGRFLSAT